MVPALAESVGASFVEDEFWVVFDAALLLAAEALAEVVLLGPPKTTSLSSSS